MTNGGRETSAVAKRSGLTTTTRLCETHHMSIADSRDARREMGRTMGRLTSCSADVIVLIMLRDRPRRVIMDPVADSSEALLDA